MPYRDDARSEDLEVRLTAARARVQAAETALARATEGAAAVNDALDGERRQLDVEVANAEDVRRAAVHAGFVRADAPSPTLRDRMRTQAVVAALERTIAEGKSTRPPAPPAGDPLAVLKGGSERRAQARRRRAVLAVEGQARLEAVSTALSEARREAEEARDALASIEAMVSARD